MIYASIWLCCQLCAEHIQRVYCVCVYARVQIYSCIFRWIFFFVLTFVCVFVSALHTHTYMFVEMDINFVFFSYVPTFSLLFCLFSFSFCCVALVPLPLSHLFCVLWFLVLLLHVKLLFIVVFIIFFFIPSTLKWVCECD